MGKPKSHEDYDYQQEIQNERALLDMLLDKLDLPGYQNTKLLFVIERDLLKTVAECVGRLYNEVFAEELGMTKNVEGE